MYYVLWVRLKVPSAGIFSGGARMHAHQRLLYVASREALPPRQLWSNAQPNSQKSRKRSNPLVEREFRLNYAGRTRATQRHHSEICRLAARGINLRRSNIMQNLLLGGFSQRRPFAENGEQSAKCRGRHSQRAASQVAALRIQDFVLVEL
eukprot:4604514-Pleurochrysis_carterae.AAC.1